MFFVVNGLQIESHEDRDEEGLENEMEFKIVGIPLLYFSGVTMEVDGAWGLN